MSKRNIRHSSGKQLYLNQIFYKGMLYTSSEMQEGYAKIIDNYDIAPTGDAASPRAPFVLYNADDKLGSVDNDYIYPVTFQQDPNHQDYIKFTRTITEEEFANNTFSNEPLGSDEDKKTVKIIQRTKNSFNDGSFGTDSLQVVDYHIASNSEEDPEDPDTEDPYTNWKDAIESDAGSLTYNPNNNEIIIKDYKYDNTISDGYASNNFTIPFNINYLYIYLTSSNYNDLPTIGNLFPDLDAIELTTDNIYIFKPFINFEDLINNDTQIINFYIKDKFNNPVYFRSISYNSDGIRFKYNNTDEYVKVYNIPTPNDIGYFTDPKYRVLYLDNNITITNSNNLNFFKNNLCFFNESLLNINTNDYFIFNSSKIEKVTDGDTFDYNGTSYRLWAADAVEKGYKWYNYSKEFLENLLNSLNGKYIKFIQKGTSFDRKVIDIVIKSSNITSIIHSIPGGSSQQQSINDILITCVGNFAQYSVSEIMLRSGLAMIRYTDITNTDQTDLDKLISYQEIAQGAYRKRWSDTDVDPYFIQNGLNISPSFKDTTLKITDDMYIEAVKIQDQYNISAKTKTNIDYVHTIYIDYLDAVGFIGRIVQNNNTPVYKGLILLKANLDDNDQLYFNIQLPYNNGDGYQPNIIEGTTDGYNLYNENLLHTSIEDDTTKAYSLDGLAILNTIPNNGSHIVNNNEIVDQGVLGQTVQLHPIINKSFYPSNVLSTTDSWGYSLKFNPIVLNYTINGSVKTLTRNCSIIKNIEDYSTQHYYTFDFTNDDGNSIFNLDSVSNISFNNISIQSLDLINPDNNYIRYNFSSTPTFYLSSINDDHISILSLLSDSDSSLFDLRAKVDISYNDGKPVSLTIIVYNNFNSINNVYSIDSSNNVNLTTRSDFNHFDRLKFYTQWLVGYQGSNIFQPLQDEQPMYKLNNDNIVISLDSNITPDLLYTINLSGNLMFKFTIQPKIKLTGDNDTSILNDYYIKNSFEEVSSVIPLFKVANEVKIITSQSLTKNINSRNATRLDIFNRQIALYGPYIGSNVLIFSKFEKYDYYPFPYSTIEITEPITWIANYKDALIIFGKYSTYMLSGGTSIAECTVNKIYENLSIKLPDVRTILPVGNNLVFFNNGQGYVIIPNTYVDSASNIKVYKLTEAISNFFYNPEEYVRSRLGTLDILDNYNYEMSFISYAQNNNIYIIVNIKCYNSNITKYIPTIFIYNQDYKYWRMYSTESFNEIVATYICEPNLNYQYIIKNKSINYDLAIIDSNNKNYKDGYNNNNDIKIPTMLGSGFLSVDTMNDKRFKDTIIELDNINNGASLDIDFQFFVDSKPVILSNEDILIIDKSAADGSNLAENDSTNYILTDKLEYESIYQNKEANPNKVTDYYGTKFNIDSTTYSITGRTHVRIPVFGKGRLPSFILKITADKYYEFINYALIYKEKDINRRA